MAVTVFAYEVRDNTGNALTGEMQAETPQIVAERLRDQGYTVVRITQQAAPRAERRPTPGRKIRHDVLAQFYRELATVIGSGMTVIQGLHVVAENTSNPTLRWAVRGLLPGVEQGQKLSENMRRFPEAFSGLSVAIVAAGEESGRLEEMLGVLAEYAERDLELQQMLRRETFYPKILGIAILTIVPGGLLIASLVGSSPVGWGVLMPIAAFAGLLGAAGLGYFLLRSYQQSRQGRLAIDRAKCSLPVFGGLTQRIVMSRFCRALAALYSAGVSMPKSVAFAAEAAANAAVAEQMRVAIPHLEAGGKLSEVLAGAQYVPNTVVAMLRTGEQTGNIDEVLGKVADYYDDETKTKVRQLGVMITPICVIIAGIFVVIVLISFYTSYFSGIMEQAGGG